VWRAARITPFLISFTITCAFFINFCALVFRCGCNALWAGADAACNIHAQHGRHCPWCSHGYVGYALEIILMSAPQLAASIWTGWNWTTRTLTAIALFPAAGLMVAVGFGIWDGYWR
jgi:hypothetical protein